MGREREEKLIHRLIKKKSDIEVILQFYNDGVHG